MAHASNRSVTASSTQVRSVRSCSSGMPAAETANPSAMASRSTCGARGGERAPGPAGRPAERVGDVAWSAICRRTGVGNCHGDTVNRQSRLIKSILYELVRTLGSARSGATGPASRPTVTRPTAPIVGPGDVAVRDRSCRHVEPQGVAGQVGVGLLPPGVALLELAEPGGVVRLDQVGQFVDDHGVEHPLRRHPEPVGDADLAGSSTVQDPHRLVWLVDHLIEDGAMPSR